MADAMQAVEGSGVVGCAVVNLKCRIGWTQACDGSVCSAHVMVVLKGGGEFGTRDGRCILAKKSLEASSGSSWMDHLRLCFVYTWLLLPARRAQNVLLSSKTHGWLWLGPWLQPLV
jgi:hypothetical protein